MNIRLIAVGKIKEKWLKMGIEEYVKRISRYSAVMIAEVPDQPESGDIRSDLDREGEKILSKIRSNDLVITLEIDGVESDSVCFASRMAGWMERGGSSVTFVIGGSNGISDAVKRRSDDTFSVSKLTFPHRLVRLIFLEQIYRAFKINNNEKYHK
ncbi:MAG: 23S rRNA (pseudouridine(1915)-N(3))-methyltransferase RlmH [Eubacteriales bacterium]|jgi:23S rRNA (pseudouridine1915-N3)-methyltransferase|nr:23S rRNA (pseudouridine(1915)-N(3))-methyltransferase RlmH [Eubacteriales bacterium]MDD4326708.1 23S rRNA (pseudouridine(1915)-N(3))-methyltransferase RlmH [Eubacteriales bacterium]MDD4716749.1 23S rRNA (pseudouridine(1915)-N(3))-methyltransferase RlmH [Eubacteriales bacterium]NCU25189.1 23S rRNA (pseudouridine(1915)-N(3))-methyltransferase RlmH [Candidatus Nomurabacteria bacterium]